MTLQAMTPNPRDRENEPPLRGELRPSGPVKLTVTESMWAGSLVISVNGELDLLTAPRVAARLEEVVRGGATDVVVDLRETVFIDSAGVHVLLKAKRRLARRSRELTVIVGPGPVRRVLELSRITDTLGVVSSFEEIGRGGQ
jgi:anti-sigma B factor antagonist